MLRSRLWVSLLLGGMLSCADEPDGRLWLAAALFLARDTVPAAIVIDTAAGEIPAASRAQLRAAGFQLGSNGPGTLTFGVPRPLGGRLHLVEVHVDREGSGAAWRLTVECRSRHCLVVDSARSGS